MKIPLDGTTQKTKAQVLDQSGWHTVCARGRVQWLYMSRGEEIELAIHELSRDEFAQIAQRFHAYEQERWDAELDRDASSGKLDLLVAEARENRKQGQLKD